MTFIAKPPRPIARRARRSRRRLLLPMPSAHLAKIVINLDIVRPESIEVHWIERHGGPRRRPPTRRMVTLPLTVFRDLRRYEAER